MDKSKLKRRYTGESAVEYENDRAGSEKWNREQETVRRFLSDAIVEYNISSILDVPIGTGRFFPLYREYSTKILGMDASEDMLAQAAEKETGTLDVELITGDIFALDETNINVDLVVCVRFLNWIETEDLSTILNNIATTSSKCAIIGVRTYPPDVDRSAPVSSTRTSMSTRVTSLPDRFGELSQRAIQILRQEGVPSLVQSTIAFIRRQFISESELNHTITVHNRTELDKSISDAGFEIVADELLEIGEDSSEYRFYLLQSSG